MKYAVVYPTTAAVIQDKVTGDKPEKFDGQFNKRIDWTQRN